MKLPEGLQTVIMCLAGSTILVGAVMILVTAVMDRIKTRQWTLDRRE